MISPVAGNEKILLPLPVLVSCFLFICSCSLLRPASVQHLENNCNEAWAASEAATRLSEREVYKTAWAAILKAADDGKEHAVSFGKDAQGNILRSGVSHGARNRTTVPDIENRFADMHNHPQNKPPSSGDLYHFIDQAVLNSQYQKFIRLPDGTIYALVLTSMDAAQKFNTRFPRIAGVYDSLAATRYQPVFPKALVEEINQMRGWGEATEEAAFAFILHKYNAGVALLKTDHQGRFRKVNTTKRADKDGSLRYIVYRCPG